ncbi:MAG: hypothetical protein IJO62_05235 [Clostridia bacterium]|nr:hypothetical protein [Clostridia bacterium]
MNWIKSLITAFCTAGICFGAIFIIFPEGKMKKPLQYVVSLCFLIIIISVAGVNVNFEKFEIDFAPAKTVNADHLETAATEYTISLILQKAEIDFREIYVYTDNSSKEGINCTKVKIYSSCDKEKILSALGGEGKEFQVEVINE